jgi:GcrA cell cycle regulator
MTKRKPEVIPKYTEGWTPERVATLKKLWEHGESASQIAAVLGDVSRNGVIGKIHRLGLPGRATTSRSIQSKKNRNGSIIRPTRVKPPTKPVKVALQPPSLPILKSLVDEMKRAVAIEEPPAGGVDILELENHHCRFPLGGVMDYPPHKFCGAPKSPGSSYCSEHRQRCVSGLYKPYIRPPRPERAMHEEEEQAA